MTNTFDTNKELTHILSNFNGALVASYSDLYESNELMHIATYRSTMVDLATFLKLSSIFNCDSAIDGLAVDGIENEYRFTIIYNIQSTVNNSGIRLVTKTVDGSALVSLQNLYPAFNWVEREMWDLSGIFFIKHPDLRRILTDYGFSGHPLRKDFPVSGFRESHYADSNKQIVYRDVELAQSFRLPSSLPVWVESN